MKTYPECDKMLAAKNESQTIGEFLDWLGANGIWLCKYKTVYDTFFKMQSEEKLVPITGGIEKLLAEYFEIDLDKVEQEKRDMLNELRKANEKQI